MAKKSPKPKRTYNSLKGLSAEQQANYNLAKKGLANQRKSANQQHRREMAKIRRQNKQTKTTEYYKTQRSLGRSGAVTATLTSAQEAREKTKRLAEQEATTRAQLASATLDQYSRLINGEQGSSNPVNEQDTSGNPTGSWVPNDTL